MNVSAPQARDQVRTGAAFGACLLITFLFPFVAIYCHSFLPRVVGNLLFFFPQLAFPFDSLVVRELYGSRRVLSDLPASMASIVQWTVVGSVFVWLASRLKGRYVVPLAFAAIVATTIAVPLCLGFFGLTVELDGP